MERVRFEYINWPDLSKDSHRRKGPEISRFLHLQKGDEAQVQRARLLPYLALLPRYRLPVHAKSRYSQKEMQYETMSYLCYDLIEEHLAETLYELVVAQNNDAIKRAFACAGLHGETLQWRRCV